MRAQTGWLMAASALLLALPGCGPLGDNRPGPAATREPAAATFTPAAGSVGGLPEVLPVYDASAVVAQVQPAVVTVVNRREAGDVFSRETLEAGRGTGFIIDQAGHVLTNAHAVRRPRGAVLHAGPRPGPARCLRGPLRGARRRGPD
ncbi:MAG: hypothetical protein ACKOWF_13600, partial [Chloroflexota bacterium]